MRRTLLGALPAGFVLAALASSAIILAQGAFSGGAPGCGPISGRTQHDLEMARTFCAGLADDMSEGAYVDDTWLVVQVNRQGADQIRTDPAAAESVVLAWLRSWKEQFDEVPVTLTVRWGAIRLARGLATPSDGDRVTFP